MYTEKRSHKEIIATRRAIIKPLQTLQEGFVVLRCSQCACTVLSPSHDTFNSLFCSSRLPSPSGWWGNRASLHNYCNFTQLASGHTSIPPCISLLPKSGFKSNVLCARPERGKNSFHIWQTLQNPHPGLIISQHYLYLRHFQNQSGSFECLIDLTRLYLRIFSLPRYPR